MQPAAGVAAPQAGQVAVWRAPDAVHSVAAGATQDLLAVRGPPAAIAAVGGVPIAA